MPVSTDWVPESDGDASIRAVVERMGFDPDEYEVTDLREPDRTMADKPACEVLATLVSDDPGAVFYIRETIAHDSVITIDRGK